MTSRTPTVPLETLVDPSRPITYGIVLPGPDVPNGVPYVRVVDMQQGTVRLEQLRRTTAAIAHSYRRSALMEGDLLVSIRGHVGRTAFVPKGGSGANLTQDTARVAILPSVDRRYIRWFIESPVARGWMAQHTKGVAVTGINLGDLRKLPVPLPHPEEQRRLANVLDKADAIRRKRKEAIALTEELLRSAFLEMFGDPVTNPKGWPVKPLGELLQTIDSGWSPVCEARPARDDEWGVLKLGAVTFGRYDEQENKALGPHLSPASELEVKAGDVLFSRKNTYEHVAACVFVANSRSKLMLPDLIFRLVPAKTSALRPETLWGVLSHEPMRKRVQGLAGGTAGSMPNISKERLKGVKLPVPSLPLQERFAGAVRGNESTRTALEAAASESEALFNSLIARAFSGGLTS